MATKPSDLLANIPSVTELLDKPPIRALADRWNRSVVAAGVRSFLDELRTDLQRRAAEAQLPSLRELAERAARHVVALQQYAERPAINATGRIQGPPWLSTPMPEAALERMFALGRDFVVGPPIQTGSVVLTAGDVVTLLCRITQAQSGAVVHSYAGAAWLALAALARKQEVLVSRAETGEIDAGRSLHQLAASARTRLIEVGTPNRTSAADYESAVTPQTAALWRLCSDVYRVVGQTESAELDELVGLARDRELPLIHALGMAPLTDLPPAFGVEPRSARASLAAGVDLVLVRGDGLVGGPQCGILVGDRELVARITEHPLYAGWQLDPLRAAALARALECYSDTTQGEPTLPVLRLLATPLENLRDRAERLAPQLLQAPGIASAIPIVTHSQLTIAGGFDRGLQSYGVALTATDGDLCGLEKRLLSATHPVVGRVENDRLILDLRTVFPRQDQGLVDAFNVSQPATPGSVGG
jgi:L-seryl-tRNA(Ser) seleniumtransferase